MVAMLIRDLYELPLGRASAVFDALAKGASAPVEAALREVRAVLREIDALEPEVRAAAPDGLRRAAALALAVETQLRVLAGGVA
jgi:hypothetical protein